MDYEEIGHSLSEMVLPEEERQLIIPVLKKREERHLKCLKIRRIGQYVIILGLAFFLSGVAIKGFSIYSNLTSYNTAFLWLVIVGPMVMAGGYFTRRFNPLLTT